MAQGKMPISVTELLAVQPKVSGVATHLLTDSEKRDLNAMPACRDAEEET